MAVNYAEKYAEAVDEKFSEESITEIAVNKDFDFTGVNKVTIYSIQTVPLNDYNMQAQTNRYGDPVELGSDVQTLELTQDKSFTFSIDRRNNDDTMMQMDAAKALAREIKEVITPHIDRYRLSILVNKALAEHKKEIAITSENAYSSFLEASMKLFDAHVPSQGRIAFVSPAFYMSVKLDKHFANSSDRAQDIVSNGQVGVIDGTTIVVVPTDMLPLNTNYIITHPCVMVAPIKIVDYKTHDQPQGINGWLVEGRLYFDAFVLNNKRSAIYVSTTPAIAPAMLKNTSK